MSGFYAPYIPGWDTHGLPIEQVLAKQGVKRKEMDLVEYLKLCREYEMCIRDSSSCYSSIRV